MDQHRSYLNHLYCVLRAAGKEYPQIWHLFAFLPRATEHLARFSQEILRGPAPLSLGFRELIAAYTSYRNDCPFLTEIPRRSCGGTLGSHDLVEGVLRNLETSSLPEKEKVLLRFVDLVNRDSPHITPPICTPCAAPGWSVEAIYFAIRVCALFNFYNRWIDASGVHALSDEAHREGGKRSAIHGYVRK